MRISLNWLKAYVDVDLPPEEVARRLTLAGLEVSGVERLGEGIAEVVVAQILERNPHPNADRLSLCRVSDGRETHDIVCGAANMQAGDRVALARVGATLPGGVTIRKAKIRGQTSSGMLCSERELGLGDDHAGILILPPGAEVGRPLVEVLGLPDHVMEVELTPNRADCLSVVGVAREVAALAGAVLRVPTPVVPEEGPAVEDQTSVEIRDPDLCHRYAARVIRGVRLAPSPVWLRQRLRSAGVRAINNVVDVTNYVLLELGHPLHAFDLQRLEGERIVVQRARPGQRFTTLDGQERTLGEDSLVICDAEGAVALAGIMGGLNSEVQDDTVDLLLESAYFLPTNIRKTSKKLGLRTEASYRFERGTDVEGLRLALDRATELIVELAGGVVARGVWDAYPTPHAARRVPLRYAKLAGVLGVEVPPGEAQARLESLGLAVVRRDSEGLEAEIPPFRVDLEREIDLIEEIARLRGYDAVPATLPTVPMTCEALPPRLVLAERTRDSLAALGLREAISLSFVDPEDDDRLGLPADSPLRRKVALANPLSRETAVLRTGLLGGLLRAAGLNARRQNRDVRLFEVGRTYHPIEGQTLPREVLGVAAVLTGRRWPLAWWADAEPVDFFDAKGLVEELLRSLGVSGARFEAAPDIPWLHPGRAARVLVGPGKGGEGTVFGWVGQIHPDRAEGYELPSPAVGFELDLEAAGRAAATPGHFPGLERFPAVERDVAVLVERSVRAQDVLDAVASVESPLVRSARLFDVFEGGRLPPGTLSLAVRVVYRSDERTLTEEEVAAVEAAILGRLEERVGARLRDT
ncbi:MAG: phenylalanine--tRNA ligase subunit beta [Deferrisomatales bacterium]